MKTPANSSQRPLSNLAETAKSKNKDSKKRPKTTPEEYREAARLLVYSNYTKGEKRHNGVIETCANICHVNPKTIYEWLDRPWFQDYLAIERQQLYRVGMNAVAHLQKSGTKGDTTANIYLAKCAFPYGFDDYMKRQMEKHAADQALLREKLAKMEGQLQALLPVPVYVEVGANQDDPPVAFPVMQ